MMKQNMCVTVDIDVHTWLRYKGGKLSTNVNRILLDAMMTEKKEEAKTYSYKCHNCGYDAEYRKQSNYHHCLICVHRENKTIWMEEIN